MNAGAMLVSHQHFVKVRQTLAGQKAWGIADKHYGSQAGDKPTLAVVDDHMTFAEGMDTPPLCYHLIYRSDSGEETRRVINLERINPDRDTLRLLCWCHASGAFRTFRADRIQEVFCAVTGEVFSNAVAYFDGHPMLNEPRDPEGYALKVCKHEISILATIAAADGHFHPDEQDALLIHVFDRLPHLSLDETVVRQRLAKLVPDCRAFEAAMWKMGRFRDGDPIALMRSIRRMIDADGHLAKEEVLFADEIRQRLATVCESPDP